MAHEKDEGLTSRTHVKRPTAAYLLYTYEKFKDLQKADAEIKLDKKLREQLKKEYEALPESGKSSYVQTCKNMSKEYMEANPLVKRVKCSIQTRMQLSKIVEIVGKLTADQRQAVIDIGLGGILSLKCTKIKRDLWEFLVKSYDTNLLCLSVHGSKLVISPTDVQNIFGLRNEGLDVSFEGLDDYSPLPELGDGTIKLKVLSDKLMGLRTHDREFQSIFVLYIFGALLCPTTVDIVSTHYLKAIDPAKIGGFNWAKYVFEFLEKRLKRYQDNEHKSPSGCILLLKLKYLDRVGARPVDADVFPCVAAWGDIEIKNRLAYIKKVGGYQSGEVEITKDEPQPRSQLVKEIVAEVERVVVAPVKQQIEATLYKFLSTPPNLNEVNPVTPIPQAPPTTPTTRPTPEATPSAPETVKANVIVSSSRHPRSAAIPSTAANVKISKKLKGKKKYKGTEDEAVVSSNVALRVKMNTKRQCSWHVSSPYCTEGMVTRKRKMVADAEGLGAKKNTRGPLPQKKQQQQQLKQLL